MEYTEALERFINKLQERENNHIKTKFKNLTPSTFTVNKGRKFDKIVKIGTQTTVFAFIKKENGAIIKAHLGKLLSHVNMNVEIYTRSIHYKERANME